jgi:hypothetical protein
MSDKPHPAAIDVGGCWHLRDAKCALRPIAAVKPMDLLMDELVRTTLDEARIVSAAIAAFKQRTFERVGELQALLALLALLAQDYHSNMGGKKGNITLSSYDGCAKLQVAVADQLEFGPELQVAKTLIDDCLRE